MEIVNKIVNGEIELQTNFNLMNEFDAIQDITDIQNKILNCKNSDTIAILLIHNNTDIDKATEAFGDPIKHTEFGEFGINVDACYTFCVKVDGKRAFLHLDDKGTSLEFESDVTRDEYLKVYEHILAKCKHVFNEQYQTHLKLGK